MSPYALGGSGPTILYAHATGFHGHCWRPIADRLPQFANVAYDARGHGDSPIDPDSDVDWQVYGLDAAAIAAALIDGVDGGDGRPILGVGHSMGGAALLMAAAAHPELFRAVLVYEPIVMTPSIVANAGQAPNPLAQGARRRRASFDSYDAALANFAAKPPMKAFDPEVRELYVRHGFALADDGTVHLKCLPEIEARHYEAGPRHRTWDLLPSIEIPVWVVSGRPEPDQPSMWMRQLCDRLPNCTFILRSEFDHFGPMQSPAAIAELIEQLADTVSTEG